MNFGTWPARPRWTGRTPEIVFFTFSDYSANIRDFDIVYSAVAFEVNYVDALHTKPFTLWPFSAGTSIHDSNIVLQK